MGFGTGSDPQMDFVGNIPCLPIYFLKNSIWCCMDARKCLFVWVLCSALFVHQSSNTSDNFIGVLMALGALRNLKTGTGGVCRPAWIVLPLNRFFWTQFHHPCGSQTIRQSSRGIGWALWLGEGWRFACMEIESPSSLESVTRSGQKAEWLRRQSAEFLPYTV